MRAVSQTVCVVHLECSVYRQWEGEGLPSCPLAFGLVMGWREFEKRVSGLPERSPVQHHLCLCTLIVWDSCYFLKGVVGKPLVCYNGINPNLGGVWESTIIPQISTTEVPADISCCSLMVISSGYWWMKRFTEMCHSCVQRILRITCICSVGKTLR